MGVHEPAGALTEYRVRHSLGLLLRRVAFGAERLDWCGVDCLRYQGRSGAPGAGAERAVTGGEMGGAALLRVPTGHAHEGRDTGEVRSSAQP